MGPNDNTGARFEEHVDKLFRGEEKEEPEERTEEKEEGC